MGESQKGQKNEKKNFICSHFGRDMLKLKVQLRTILRGQIKGGGEKKRETSFSSTSVT
jgi:hypothetical protein